MPPPTGPSHGPNWFLKSLSFFFFFFIFIVSINELFYTIESIWLLDWEVQRGFLDLCCLNCLLNLCKHSLFSFLPSLRGSRDLPYFLMEMGRKGRKWIYGSIHEPWTPSPAWPVPEMGWDMPSRRPDPFYISSFNPLFFFFFFLILLFRNWLTKNF